MTHDEIIKLEDSLILSRYTDGSVKREEAANMVREIIRCHNEIATLKGDTIPFPDNRNRKPERKSVGFDGSAA